MIDKPGRRRAHSTPEPLFLKTPASPYRSSVRWVLYRPDPGARAKKPWWVFWGPVPIPKEGLSGAPYRKPQYAINVKWKAVP